jgi:methyl halide transferase
MTDRTTNPNLLPEQWENRYQTSDHPWDLGCPAPPFINLLNSPQAPPPGKLAVLGCGTGQDALLFAESGFTVTAFDFAPSAINRATLAAQARNIPAQFLQRDIFALESDFHHQFDYVLEHTCFCAIDPTLRPSYLQVVKQLLREQGQLIALFYTHNRPSGPPFGTKPQEILDYFTPDFDRLLFKPAEDSIDRRKGEEHLALFQRLPSA